MNSLWTVVGLVFVMWQASAGEQYAGMWTGTYDGSGNAEIVMTATFEPASATGTWSLRPKGQPDELASGGIAVTKK